MSVSSLRRLLLFGAFSCLVLVGNIQAQKIRRNKPAVYITFKEFVKKTASESNPTIGARLVLHNNTRWPIRYAEWLEPTLRGDAAVIYNIESTENGCYIPRGHLDVITRGKVRPGRSVSFTVPREDLPAGSEIYVRFDYSWELDNDQSFPGEAEHRAYFYSADIPHWPLG